MNPFSSKSDFARFENNQQNYVAQRCSEKRSERMRRSANPSPSKLALPRCKRRPQLFPDGHTVWNDEMFQIDKRSNEQKRSENPVCNRHLPRKALPDREEQQRRDQFHREIAKRLFLRRNLHNDPGEKSN